MYSLRLFIVVLQELHCLPNYLELDVAITSSSFVTPHLLVVVSSSKSMCVPSFILIGCCVSELHGHLCVYRNVWPEGCFTRTTNMFV